MHEKWRWSDLAFGLAFLLAFVAFLRVLLPFLGPLVLAILVVSLLSPLYERLANRLGGRRRIAAFIASLGVLLAVIAPSLLVGFLLLEQAVELAGRLVELLGEGTFPERLGRLGGVVAPIYERLEALGIADALRAAAAQIGTLLSKQIGPALGALVDIGIGSFILVIGLYYLFQDGSALFEELVEITPMDPAYAREVGADLAAVLRSLFLATFFTALVQGVLGLVAFAIVGLPHALAWAALMAFFSILFSLIPILGTGLVWVPVAVWLFVQGRWIAGLFILGWGLLVLGSVDNVIRPLITRATGSLHPLLVLLTVFGGLAFFGPIGAILGPLVGAVAAAFVRVWIRDVRPQLE
jgi:predicted PurR-regulated permease PerM